MQFSGYVYGQPDGHKVYVTVDADTYARLGVAIANYGGKKPLFDGNKCEVRFDGLQPTFAPGTLYDFEVKPRKYSPPRAVMPRSGSTLDDASGMCNGFVKFAVQRCTPRPLAQVVRIVRAAGDSPTSSTPNTSSGSIADTSSGSIAEGFTYGARREELSAINALGAAAVAASISPR